MNKFFWFLFLIYILIFFLVEIKTNKFFIMAEPSTFHAKPRASRGKHISTMPLGITGLETEPYSYHNSLYEGIGGEGEMSWLKFILMVVAILALLGGGFYAYSLYSKANMAQGIAGGLLQQFKR